MAKNKLCRLVSQSYVKTFSPGGANSEWEPVKFTYKDVVFRILPDAKASKLAKLTPQTVLAPKSEIDHGARTSSRKWKRSGNRTGLNFNHVGLNAFFGYTDRRVARGGQISKLSPAASAAIEASSVAISPMVLLELEYLYEIKRIVKQPLALLNELHTQIGWK